MSEIIIGGKEVAPLFIDSLKSMESGRYDKTGLCVTNKTNIKILKKNNLSSKAVLISCLFLLIILGTLNVSAQTGISLDGTGEVRVNDADTLDSFSKATWNMWVKQDVYNTNVGIAGKYIANLNGRSYLIRTSLINGSSISVALSEDGVNTGLYTSYSNLKCGIHENDQWTMITVTYNGSLIEYYRNGVLCDQDETIIASIYNSYSPLRLGAGNSIFFNGEIDEYTFYNNKLAPEQISRLYAESFHGANLGDSIPVLVYHEIKSPANNQIMVTQKDFATQMDYLSQNGFTTVTLRDYLNWKKGNFIMPQKAIILVFDDGFKTVFTEAMPIMKGYGFIGTLASVTRYASFTGNNTGYMKWNEINSLVNSGWDVESHSVTHSHMLSLNESEFRLELYNSREAIANKTGIIPQSFVFPFHESNQSYTKICAEYYDLCWTQGSLNPTYNFISTNGQTYLGLRRINVVNTLTMDDFANFLGRDTDKFGEWNIDEGIGLKTEDTSGNQNTGYLLAGAYWSILMNQQFSNPLSAITKASVAILIPLTNNNNKGEQGNKIDGLDNVIDSDYEKAPMEIFEENQKYPDNMDIEGEYYATHDPIKLEIQREKESKLNVL